MGSGGVNDAAYIRTKGTGALNLGTNYIDNLTITSSGKVGIGTTTPVAGLDIATTAGDTWTTSNWDSGLILNADSMMRWRLSGGHCWGIGSSGSTLYFGHSTSQTTGAAAVYPMVIDAANNRVGIGTSAPSNTLSVTGSFNVHASKGVDSFTVSSSFVKSENIRQTTTASAASVGINATTGYLYRLTSALKYKTDVETMADEYADAILDLRPVWYKSLGPHDPSDWGYWGLIAEEVAAVDPRLVHYGVPEIYEPATDAEGEPVGPTAADLTEPEGVQYERFVPHLINLVARQRADIEELRKRLAVLEAEK